MLKRPSRLLSKLLRDPALGKLVVPIVPDEARTFGMEALFRQVGVDLNIQPPRAKRLDLARVELERGAQRAVGGMRDLDIENRRSAHPGCRPHVQLGAAGSPLHQTLKWR